MQRHAEYYTKNMGLRGSPAAARYRHPSRMQGRHHRPSANRGMVGRRQYIQCRYRHRYGLVVLDVDTAHDAGKFGDETLADLEQQYGPLPETWTCLTGGGGVTTTSV